MKRRIIAFAICAFLTALISVLFFATLNNAVSQLPNAAQMTYDYNSEFYPITISKWEEYQNRFSTTDVSFCAELDETDVKDNAITPVLTNENWFFVMNITITGGLKENTKAAVISSDLALKVYFNTDVIGKKLIINNSEYIISGIYQNPKGIINELSSDGKERVYLYYTDYPAYNSQDVQSICYRNDAPSAPLIEQMNLSQYHAENIGEKAKILNNFKSLFILILFLYFSVIVLKLWYKLSKKILKEIKENLTENYFINSIKSIPLKYFLFILSFVGIPAIIILAFIFTNFSFFIPARYIPYDNIFDVPYYITKIVEYKNSVHQLAQIGNTYYIELYKHSFYTLSLLLTCAICLISHISFSISCVPTKTKYIF